MARAASRDIPPPLELQCLKALWILGEANVRDVRQVLLPERKLAYTTVMTVLDRLARRGGVQRRKVGRAFIYAPVLSREFLRKAAIKELVDSFFDGSQESLLSYLGSTTETRTNLTVPGRRDAVVETDLDTSLL
jgi:predicted transcriptional regulator